MTREQQPKTPEENDLQQWFETLLEQSRYWSVRVWVALTIMFLGACAMATLVILFVLTLMFTGGGA